MEHSLNVHTDYHGGDVMAGGSPDHIESTVREGRERERRGEERERTRAGVQLLSPVYSAPGWVRPMGWCHLPLGWILTSPLCYSENTVIDATRDVFLWRF